MYVLGLDVGGTNTRIGLFEKETFFLVRKDKIPTRDVKNISELVETFSSKKIGAIGIGFAGPVTGNKARLTNADFLINVNKLKRKTKIDKILLMNDFYAAAKGIKYVDKKKIKILKRGKLSNDVKVVIGPGTGLGKAHIIGRKIYPTEGGLVEVGIQNKEEIGLVKHVSQDDFLYYEDILSAEGLEKIYLFYSKKPRDVYDIIEEKSEVSKKTIEAFCRFYVRFLRISALDVLASEIFLVGGLTKSIEKSLKKKIRKEFTNHRTYSSLLKKIKINLVKDEFTGVKGAAASVLY